MVVVQRAQQVVNLGLRLFWTLKWPNSNWKAADCLVYLTPAPPVTAVAKIIVRNKWFKTIKKKSVGPLTVISPTGHQQFKSICAVIWMWALLSDWAVCLHAYVTQLNQLSPHDKKLRLISALLFSVKLHSMASFSISGWELLYAGNIFQVPKFKRKTCKEHFM